MDALLTKIGESGLPIVIAAIIAFLAATVSAIFALSIARRNTYLTTVTTERSKWIDKLRTNISEFAAICAYLQNKCFMDKYNPIPMSGVPSPKFDKSPEYDDLMRKLENLQAVIQLQLNPRGKIDKNILAVVQRIKHLAVQGDSTVFSAHWLLIGHSQWLLKEEWETVKFEAAGWCRRFILIVKRWRRAWKYRDFCRYDGSLETLAVDKGEPSPSD